MGKKLSTFIGDSTYMKAPPNYRSPLRSNNKWNGDGKVTKRVHVDDLKISSRSKDRINEVIDELRSTYDEITVHFGDEHD